MSQPHNKRITLIVRLWPHGDKPLVWIGEVQDAQTGEMVHLCGLEELFDLFRQKISRAMQSPEEKE
ncbi:MAG: hypothetical protein EHM70_00590 [Chloroflexota bacterium]|nr:MAG: hypothetical protein EHM70_00590 [Chloroflexota bacterium]